MNTAPTGVARLHPEHDTRVAEALLHLQIAAYRVEAALIGSPAIPGLTDTVDALRGAGSTWFGVVESGGRADAPARRLYESAGFRGAGHTEVEPGLWISHYAWEPPQPRRT
ncbi:hypothetical protein ACVGVM_24190 [Pseudonocardia bannensis]|uniref:N-acetyltransferase domain-containing protein n=1 Tax=Pseudonocardia bannensis TaxID=630973 RepID=A0A848DGC1_9PSEU|nr:hypothetical protein [Pseudonocardia bannensis]NMH91583.1 hypothetical protein [Pseudonocardia bannensis]